MQVLQTRRAESGSQIAPNWPKIEKMTMTSQFVNMTSSQIFLTLLCFSCQGLVTGPSFMSISPLVLELLQFSFIRNWAEIQKSEIPPFNFLPNIWRLQWVKDITFGMNVSNEMLLNAAKCQGYSFNRLWVTKGKPPAGWVNLTTTIPHQD